MTLVDVLATLAIGLAVALWIFLLKRFDRVFTKLAEIQACVEGTKDRPGLAAEMCEHGRMLQDHEGRIITLEERTAP